MPRCQRTFRRLNARAAEASGCFVCPVCAGQEVYRRVFAPDLRRYASDAEASCRALFSVPEDDRRTDLYLGLFPECVFEPDDGRYEIYLQSGSDAFQLRLQIGHEVFHRVCSQGAIYHWTHEMLACLFSVWFLEEAGLAEYAEQTDRDYAGEAAHLPLAGLLALNLSAPPYPRGAYGRAYATGRALAAVAGKDRLCRLARCLDRNGVPDLRQWINSLRADDALAVRQLMNMEL